MLIDEAKIYVRSGDGGDGIVSFRREKYVPHGGPNGGDGGKGGDVIFKVNAHLNTLFYFQRYTHFKAKHGTKGGSSNKTGSNAEDLIVEVPAGTLIRDANSDEVLADLTDEGEQVIIVRGGRGGKGNARFATASNRAPRMAERGAPGEERWLKLELKLIADVGIVGVPNAGKSTLLSVVSNAKPRIADYPFTTIQPNLGVVVYGHRDLIFADIPGLIEGAHAGIGLGHAFLRHVQRTKILIHVLDGESDDPVADYNQINAELALYDEQLAQRPRIVVFNKMDLPEAQEYFPLVKEALAKRDVDVLPISAVTQHNISLLVQQVFEKMANLPQQMEKYSVEEIETYELQDPGPIFTLKKTNEHTYVVRGERIERAAAMTYWDYDEAIARFQKILETLGVSAALKEAGVAPGDTVFIGAYELEWAD